MGQLDINLGPTWGHLGPTFCHLPNANSPSRLPTTHRLVRELPTPIYFYIHHPLHRCTFASLCYGTIVPLHRCINEPGPAECAERLNKLPYDLDTDFEGRSLGGLRPPPDPPFHMVKCKRKLPYHLDVDFEGRSETNI